MKSQNSTLYISCRAGNGHELVRKVLQDKNPDPSEAKCVLEFLGKQTATIIKAQWAAAQKDTNLAQQERMVSLQPWAQRVFYVPTYLGVLSWLRKTTGVNYPRRIVSTQPLIKPALSALRVYNAFMKTPLAKGKNWEEVGLDLWMTDLPDNAMHFYTGLGVLNSAEKKLLHVYSAEPSRGPDGKYTVDIAKKCGLKPEQVHYLEAHELQVPPIYHSKELHNWTKGKDCSFQLKLTEQQKDLLPKGIQKKLEFKSELKYDYQVGANDKMYHLMLGSQPTLSTVNDFIDSLAATAELAQRQKTLKSTDTYHALLLCGKDNGKDDCVFRTICRKLNKLDLPENVNIVALPFQDPSMIACFSARADAGDFTRAGGATSMQHIALNANLGEKRGKVYILAEVPIEGLDSLEGEERTQEVLRHIPVWEGGNASHLHHKIGANVISHSRFTDVFAKDFKVKPYEVEVKKATKTLFSS